jgi:hypothetical protein
VLDRLAALDLSGRLLEDLVASGFRVVASGAADGPQLQAALLRLLNQQADHAEALVAARQTGPGRSLGAPHNPNALLQMFDHFISNPVEFARELSVANKQELTSQLQLGRSAYARYILDLYAEMVRRACAQNYQGGFGAEGADYMATWGAAVGGSPEHSGAYMAAFNAAYINDALVPGYSPLLTVLLMRMYKGHTSSNSGHVGRHFTQSFLGQSNLHPLLAASEDLNLWGAREGRAATSLRRSHVVRAGGSRYRAP